MAIVGVVCQKGGVGKTMTVVNVAPEIARQGKRVLVVDLDPQSPVAGKFGTAVPAERVLVADAITEASDLGHCVLPTAHENLFVIPGDKTTRVEELPEEPERLSEALAPIAGDYDFVLIDTKGHLDRITTNVALASDWVILCLESDSDCIDSTQETIEFIHSVVAERADVNPMTFIKVLRTIWDGRTILCKKLDEILDELEHPPFETAIARCEALRKARNEQATIFEYRKTHPFERAARNAAANFESLAREVIEYDENRNRQQAVANA